MNKKLNYYLNQLNKADEKTHKIFKYLKSLEAETYNEQLQININRICTIDEILTQLIICLEIDLKEKNDE